MRNSDAIRFLVRLTALLPLAGALMLIDWISLQPPIRRRFTGTLEAAADALVSGKTIWSRADTHDLKPLWIEHLSGPGEVLVLGSSRLMQVPHEWFQPRGVLNAAMFSGDLADFVSIFQLCVATGKTPQLVLLDLNPTLAFEGKSSVAPALAPHYRRALLRYRIFPPTLFSGLFLLQGLRWDPRTFLHPPAWGISEAMVPDAYRMRPDGSADWGLTESYQTPDEVESSVVASIHRLDPTYRHWRATSQPGWFDLKILRAFLDDLQSRRIRVVVMLVPVHPVAYDFYSSQGGYDESWIRREMAARGITVVGSYSPSVAKATRADFYDDVHVHASLLHRLLGEGGIIQE
jgi:hypothetical protein